MKSIKVSDYLEIIRPNYIYLKITPDTSIRNYNSAIIAQSVGHMYRTIWERIRKEEKKLKWIVNTPTKCSYLVDITKTNVEFYFIVPAQFVTGIKEKIQETWKKVSIEEVGEIKEFSQSALKYQMNYKKEDALSLAVNKSSNEPLNSIFNVIDIMLSDDRIGIFYNFIPCHQVPFRKEYADTMLKIKGNKPIDKEKLNAKYIGKIVAYGLIGILDAVKEVMIDFTGGISNKKSSELSFLEVASEVLRDTKVLSTMTKKKKEAMVLTTQMLILSESVDKTRECNNAISVCQSYKAVTEDKDSGNELVYKKVNSKNTFYMNNLVIAGVDKNTVSTDECQNFIQLPAKDLLTQYNKIKKIDTLESPVPEELQQGVMNIGMVTHKAVGQKAYLSTDEEYKNLTLCLIAPTRAGKTKLIGNLSNDGINAGECVIIFDFCGNCELSDEVGNVVNHKLDVDCSNETSLQGLGYNEIEPKHDTPFERYRCAKAKTSQLMTLINSLAEDELKDRMERYSQSAAILVFIQNGSINEVFQVLRDHKIRAEFIKSAPQDNMENLVEYIESLEELDEWSRATKAEPAEIIGTKMSFVQGILNRVNKLKENTYMEMMLKKDCSNNINLIDEMQKNQLICIRMPEFMFLTEQEKDIYCTYWLTKIWGALQVRRWNIPDVIKDQRIKVNLIIDELSQVPTCQSFLKTKLSQIAKFTAKPIISCHYLDQIENIKAEMKSANASYMLIQGCDKKNFNELKQEFEPYELGDLLHLKRYESLNLIKYENGYAKFISKLPKPLS